MTFAFSILVFFLFTTIDIIGVFQGNLKFDVFRFFVSLPSIAVVVIPAFFLAWSTTSRSSFKSCFILIFSYKNKVDRSKVAESCQFLKVFGNLGLLLGGFYTISGTIFSLINDDFSGNIEQNLSVAMLAFYYALALKIIVYTAEYRIRNRHLIT